MSDSPFDFFRQETSNIDVEIRTEAMKKVALIAALMGPDKSRSEMLPYLLSNPSSSLLISYFFYTL